MFEFKTAIHAIPANQLYLYYFVLFLLYLFFLRGVKLTLLSTTIMLLFNQGFLLLIDDQGVPIKVLFIFLALALLFRARFTTISKREIWILFLSLLFMMLFYWNYVYSGVSLLWASYQYYKYFIPVALFFGIRGLQLTSEQNNYYAHLIIKLMWFQIAFSIVKLMILGFRENIIGSIGNTGGNIGITFAICSIVLYWLLKGKEFKGRSWWFVLLVLIIPMASNKRAIWLLYPIILTLLITHQITRQTLRKIAYAMFLVPVVLYLGFRLNPTLNPERKLWGSFDPQFATDYIFSYSGVSAEKRESDLARGRWGTAMTVMSNVFQRPLSTQSLLGFPRSRTGRLDLEEFNMEDYGLAYGAITSGIVMMLLQNGWPATLLLLLVYMYMIATIPDKRTRNILMFFMLWDTFMYAGTVVNSITNNLIFVLTVLIARNYTAKAYSLEYINERKMQPMALPSAAHNL